MQELDVKPELKPEPNECPLSLRPLHVLSRDLATECRWFVDERLFFLPAEHERLKDALLQLEDLRRRAFGSQPGGQPESTVRLMRKYFDDFSALCARLPIDEEHCCLQFAWDFSALSRQVEWQMEHSGAEVERACVLYTIAAHQSLQASKIRFVNLKSLRHQTFLYKDAAELLQCVRLLVEQAGQMDWPLCFRPPALDALSWVMLAEAYGCLFKRHLKLTDTTAEDRLAAGSHAVAAYRTAEQKLREAAASGEIEQASPPPSLELLVKVAAKQRYLLARHYQHVLQSTVASHANFESMLHFGRRSVRLMKKADELVPVVFADYLRHLQRQLEHFVQLFGRNFKRLPAGAPREEIAAEPASVELDVTPAAFPLCEDAGDPFEFVGDWRTREEIGALRAGITADLRLQVGRLEKAVYDLRCDTAIYALFLEDLREPAHLPASFEQKRQSLEKQGGHAAFSERAKALERANAKTKLIVDYFVHQLEEWKAADEPSDEAPQQRVKERIERKLVEARKLLEAHFEKHDGLHARVKQTVGGLEVLGRDKAVRFAVHSLLSLVCFQLLVACISEWEEGVRAPLSDDDLLQLRTQMALVNQFLSKAEEIDRNAEKVFWTGADGREEFGTFGQWEAALGQRRAAVAAFRTAVEEQLAAAAAIRAGLNATVRRMAASGFRLEQSDRHAQLAALCRSFFAFAHLQRVMSEGFQFLERINDALRSINPAVFHKAEEAVHPHV
ncbi:hypothetical protein M3Y99_01866400 [Aphelenchoides fujianensis]|nr:hypothetical protein M3Y99_01866400 [Aphelenchoides fujianensis]